MNFRRFPFHFNSTDPGEKQQELQKRFGLTSNDKMHLDWENTSAMDAGSKCSSTNSSPRLQHRVPAFMDDELDTGTNNVDEVRKPKVRVVPIQVESPGIHRHRMYSGSEDYSNSGNSRDYKNSDDSFFPVSKRFENDSSIEEKIKQSNEKQRARTHNIPIHIVTKGGVKKKTASPKKNLSSIVKTPEVNGIDNVGISFPLNAISAVLKELKTYKAGVESFSGTAKDKRYRYLDEMLTRCMLKLDNVDTMGNEQVRLARKSAIKEVQALLDRLESVLDTNLNNSTSNAQDLEQTAAVEVNGITEDVEMKDVDNEKVSTAVDVCKEIEQKEQLSLDDNAQVQASLENTEAQLSTSVEPSSVPEAEMNDGKCMEILPDVALGEIQTYKVASVPNMQDIVETETSSIDVPKSNVDIKSVPLTVDAQESQHVSDI